MKFLLSPHNDDAVLFSCFNLLRDRPLVITLLDSYVQPARGHVGCDAVTRRVEDIKACEVLGVSVEFFGFRDDKPNWEGIELRLRNCKPEMVYAPAVEDGGHDHHNRVGAMADRIWPGRVRHYMTYTNRGKSTGVLVPYEPAWVGLKLQALACYKSQISLENCVDHFIRDQREYCQ